MAAAAFAPLFWTVPWAGWLPPAGLVLGGLALRYYDLAPLIF